MFKSDSQMEKAIVTAIVCGIAYFALGPIGVGLVAIGFLYKKAKKP